MLVCFNLSEQLQHTTMPLLEGIIEQFGHKLPTAKLTNDA
jgi:hypothetical protein